MREVLLKLSAAAVSLLLLLAGGEAVVRVYEIFNPVYKLYDPQVGFRYVPGVSIDKFNEESRRIIRLRFNREGFRDIDHDLQKKGLRIAVLGDSFVAANQVDFEDNFHQLLQQSLNDTGLSNAEVLNYGVSGYSTAQSYKVYQDYAAKYSPDVVVYALFMGNDIGDNTPQLSRKGRIFYSLDHAGSLGSEPQLAEDIYGQGLLSHSMLYRFVQRRWERIKRKTIYYSGGRELMHRYNVFLQQPPEPWLLAWQVTEQLLVNFKRRVELDGARFVLMLIPDAIQVYPEYWNEAMNNHVQALAGAKDPLAPLNRARQIATQHGMHLLDLHPVLVSDFAQTGQYRYFGRAHFNEGGHRLVSRELKNAIEGVLADNPKESP